MIEHVIFTADADDDVAASYDWYEMREPGLGEEFLRSIEACVRGIQRHPKCIPWPSMSFGVRLFAAFLSRFSTS
jgi:plasmid stabilization system protein ParE